MVFGNSCSPFLLNATVKHHLSCFENSRVLSELKDNLYVDDWLSGADTESEIRDMISSATEIMKKGGFPLTKWGSNSSLSQTDSKGFDEMAPGISSSLKILGMHWATHKDCFYFEAPINDMADVIYTKRLVLSFIARIYDPLGFLNPFTVLIKILFQDLWLLGLGWDDPIPNELQNKMSTWVQGFKDIKEFQIPRCISLHQWSEEDKQLLCFSDASTRAFGCCVYLKVTVEGHSKMSLVASRVRVAPLKRVTLPRLELLGALLAARLLAFVRTTLELPTEIPYTCFTDSTIALAWIKADPNKWKQFVRNRVSEIHTLTNPANWYHIAGTNNPADLLTRGICASSLTNSSQWLEGPEKIDILNSNQDEKESKEIDILSEVNPRIVPVLVNIQTPTQTDFKRFSFFPRVVKVFGWVLRFVHNLKLSSQERQKNKQGLDSDELETSQTCLFKLVQQDHFSEEMHCLREGRVVSKKSPLFKLSPFVDDGGLMRVGGRLQMSRSYTFEEKHPIILPKCHLSYLLVRFLHQFLKHAGVASLLTSLRNKYWIFGARVLSKKVCRECIHCQKQDSRACSQIMAPLPSDRISRSYPFAVVGVDHAGPLYCSDTGDKKHYILLFTCGAIRAIHLELVPALSLAAFMLALRKFSARRGLPSVIYSDNAKTFEAANSLIKQFGPAAPKWKFSVPLGPFWGGWWEILVKSTKSALKKSLGKSSVTMAELETVLAEIEACINSRPLTYLEENGNPLTPSHFLLGRSSPFVGACFDENAIPQTPSDFYLASKEQMVALEKFWCIWSEDYIRNLPSLGNGRSKRDLQVGSIVLIRQDGKPRLKWPLGRVTRVFEGKDGLVRAVNLKTVKGEITRPVQLLHKLEVSDTVTEPTEVEVSVETSDDVDPMVSAEMHSIKDSQTSSATSRFGRNIRPRSVLDL